MELKKKKYGDKKKQLEDDTFGDEDGSDRGAGDEADDGADGAYGAIEVKRKCAWAAPGNLVKKDYGKTMIKCK